LIKRESDFGKLEGQINCELPNNAIYKFEGNIEISTMANRISLGADNMVLRGSSLRNTEYVYAIAVFTGHDTKVMQNSAQAKMKFSRLDLMTNRCIFVIMFL
jgi:magnesium-transporting ATPase (P-type)